ncbi:Ribonuclease H-like superfamily protein with retrovirus polyprotein domain [Klebsormidium nitens]|uniref:Ribonuclease H-like superfamily protein with retrovirus polyprotein domain n=1 Tax=Klebsormidium nitens TaxID=105231 RepID=A0A1Y1IKG7_KLENI|nr:Ribonuclease H-like superfamily protein with retrovirus polyprotein domain [Klebsormidium nitens]|eukprot:GAQ91264.1 Ribonuclease H-like superfamily protein with retrovirus polyprotein domain [Klebsormidium nitens]
MTLEDPGQGAQTQSLDEPPIGAMEPAQGSAHETPSADRFALLQTQAHERETTSTEEEEMIAMLTGNLDQHLGWDTQQILEGATRSTRADRMRKEPEGFDADVLQVLTRQRNFVRNGGYQTPLSQSTLVERVAITILTACPGVPPDEVLAEAKKAILNMREDYTENIISAVRDNLRNRSQPALSEGIEEGPAAETAASAAFDLTNLPLPEPEEYLIEDPQVVAYLCRGQLPDLTELNVKQRKEARRQIRDRAQL